MISKTKKFVFIHVPKTEGNSVQDALRHFCDDKITVVDPSQDGINRFEVRNSEWPNLVKHSTLNDYNKVLGSRIPKFFVFTTIRNPFDKLVSFYFSPHRGDVKWDFNEFKNFVYSVPPLDDFLITKRKFFLTPKVDVSKVDKFLRFEHISDDFSDLCKTLRIYNIHLSHRNRSLTRRDYRECYDKSLRKYVEQRHQLEITLGNYVF